MSPNNCVKKLQLAVSPARFPAFLPSRGFGLFLAYFTVVCQFFGFRVYLLEAIFSGGK